MTIANTLNFSPSTPAPPSGQQNVVPANDAGAPTCNQSFSDPPMVGDTGSGGTGGNVPAPGSGDAAAGKFLKADGTWAVPPGAGGTFTPEIVTFSGTSGTLANTPLVGTFFALFRNGVIMATSGAPTVQTFSISGASITLSTAAGGGDWFYALYYH